MRAQPGRQIFGSALDRPWALVEVGGDHRPGRRPPTRVAYLTDPWSKEGTVDGGFEGGIVEYYRAKDEPCARWHFAYRHPKRFTFHEVLYRFPCGKSRGDGPSIEMVNAAKRKLRVIPGEPRIECQACHREVDLATECTEWTLQQWRCPHCENWNDHPKDRKPAGERV